MEDQTEENQQYENLPIHRTELNDHTENNLTEQNQSLNVTEETISFTKPKPTILHRKFKPTSIIQFPKRPSKLLIAILVIIVLLLAICAGATCWFCGRKMPTSSLTQSNSKSNSSKTNAVSSTPTPLCSVDYSQVPKMSDFAVKADQLCDEIYPKISQKLGNVNPLEKIQLVFVKSQLNPGQTSGNIISLDSNWYAQHPDDLGSIAHEITHVVQSYPTNVSWITEGMADYIRYWAGYQTSWSYPHCGAGSLSYTSGYWCAATFLRFIEKTYDPNIVPELNSALDNNNYNDSLFVSYTGKDLSQLWAECIMQDCAGGSP
ncbi:MAG TPA: basic secretory protein-like protein [Patescibacteria group bacterium]|nr:basic secretory protein-like protein [Patescibacteria group bacterium]